MTQQEYQEQIKALQAFESVPISQNSPTDLSNSDKETQITTRSNSAQDEWLEEAKEETKPDEKIVNRSVEK